MTCEDAHFDHYDDARVGSLVKRLSETIDRSENNKMRALGVSSSQLRVLIDLARGEKGGLSLRELQERAHVSQPTMWGIVRRLEGKGLVASETAGARAKSVRLTEEGERVVVCGRAFVDEEERHLLDALDADERETFVRLLAKVCSAL